MHAGKRIKVSQLFKKKVIIQTVSSPLQHFAEYFSFQQHKHISS